MPLLSFFSCSLHQGNADYSRKMLLAFDLIAFILFTLAFIYYTNFYQPQWLTNEGVLLWKSSNTRPLIFLYIYIIFFVTTRLSLINLLGPKISLARIISIESQMYVNAHWLTKTLLFSVFCYISFVALFLPIFNAGFGPMAVIKGMDVHMMSNLAPLSQYLEWDKTLYLETPTQYAPGTMYLQGVMSDIFGLTIADAYRVQLLLNLITLVVFCVFIVGLTGPLFGSVIFLFVLSSFSVTNNFSFPGWGVFLRWMPLPVLGIILGRILTTDSKFSGQYLMLIALGMAWALTAMFSQESFGGGIISHSLVFILLLRFRTCTLQSYVGRYLLFIATFATTFSVLIGLFFGFDRLSDFYSLYTNFSGRVLAGASSVFFTDVTKLANNASGLIYVGIMFLGVPILAAAIHLISTVQRDLFYTRDIAIFAAIVASATALNLISYMRSDIPHVASASFMMLPLFVAYIVFYIRWFSERSTFTTMIAFIAAMLSVAALWESREGSLFNVHNGAKRYLSALSTPPDTDNLALWMRGQSEDYTHPDFSRFLISSSDELRKEAYRTVIGRYSSLPKEQDWVIARHAKTIARQAEIRLAMGDREVVYGGFSSLPSVLDPPAAGAHPLFGIFGNEASDFFLTGLRSATDIILPETNVWTEADLEKWRSDARSRDELCISTRVSDHVDWLIAPDKVADLAIERVTTAASFAGETTTFLCKCTPSDDNPDCHPIQDHTHDYLTRVESDFSSVQSALEKFHSDNGHYPVSSLQGASWDGFQASWEEGTMDWIQGLTPGYISELPVDPRGGVGGSTNYIYKSDGKAYKLVAQNPFPLSCQIADIEYPMLVDPKRSGPECTGVAIYSLGAERW